MTCIWNGTKYCVAVGLLVENGQSWLNFSLGPNWLDYDEERVIFRREALESKMYAIGADGAPCIDEHGLARPERLLYVADGNEDPICAASGCN